MRVNRTTRYATDFMVEIARGTGEAPVTVGRIARECSLPLAFLKQVATTLTRAGLLRAHPGCRGGYVLALPAESITLRNIIEALDGPIEAPARETEPGTAYDLWTELANEWATVLDGHSLSEIMRLYRVREQ